MGGERRRVVSGTVPRVSEANDDAGTMLGGVVARVGDRGSLWALSPFGSAARPPSNMPLSTSYRVLRTRPGRSFSFVFLLT